jgi:hypothetical protein
MDSLDLSHVTVRSISNQRFSIPIKVETVENTEEITALIDSGAEGLFIDKSIAHKWRTSVTTWYGLLHYANLIRRTGPYIVFFQPT